MNADVYICTRRASTSLAPLLRYSAFGCVRPAMAMAYVHDSKDGLAHRPSDPWATGVRPLSQSAGVDTKGIVRDDTFYYDHVVFLVSV